MDHNSQIRNVYTAAGMQENRKLDADTNGTTAEEAEGSAYPEKTADEKKGAGKAGIPGVYEGDHAEEKSGFADAESLSDRWCDLCDRTGDLKLLSVAWHGERYRRKLVLSTVDPAQCSADGL